MDEKLTNTEDLNNNGIPDWFEVMADEQTSFPGGDLGHAYTSEDKIAAKIPNYKEYKWYQNPAMDGHPGTEYFYTLGEKLEDKIESGEITPDELPEGSDIQKEAEQLYDDNPHNDEVNNKAIAKADFDNMSIDEIESRDAETINNNAPYLQVANDLGLEEDDLLYFEQPGFISELPEEVKEDIKNEPDKQKKIEKLKKYQEISVGNISAPNSDVSLPDIGGVENSETNISDSTPISDSAPSVANVRPGSFLRDSISGSDISIPSISTDNRESETNDNATSSIKVDNKEQDNNAGSINGTVSNNEHLDDTFDNLKFDETKEKEKNIKTNGQADLVSGDAVHTSKNEGIDIKDLIKNSAGKNTLPFKFFFDGDDIIVAEIGTGRKLPLEEFIKVEPNSANRIIEVLNESV